MKRIKIAVAKWMPYVELQTFDKTNEGRIQGSNVAEIRLRIRYAVAKLGITNKAIELTFFLAG